MPAEWYDKFGLGYTDAVNPWMIVWNTWKQIKGIHKISVSAWVKRF